MVRELWNGKMGLNMLGNGKMEKNMEKDINFGQTEKLTKDNSTKIQWKEMH